MMMVELTAIETSALPLSDLSDHLRLSQGFADDGDQDAQLEASLRAAIAAIESRVGKALLERSFQLMLVHWQAADYHVLPLAPVKSIDAVRIVGSDGSEETVDPSRYAFEADAHAPCLRSKSGAFPKPRTGGRIELDFTAGFAADWDALSADLRQAVIILAGAFWAQDIEPDAGLPFVVSILLEPYRRLRLRGLAS